MDEPLTRRSSLKRLAFLAAASAFPYPLTHHLAVHAHALESQPEPTPAERQAMADIARSFMEQYAVPGLSVAIARHGYLVYRDGFGMADVEAREKVTPDHLFRIASVTKPITSVAIHSLLEKGSLRLEDRVFGAAGLLGLDYGNAYPEDVEEITIAHLLTHTAGGWTNDDSDPMYLDPALSATQLIAWTLQNVPLKTTPGATFAYSNFGYFILGRVLEKLSGQSYESHIRREILERCGIQNMRIAGNSPSQRAPGEVTYYGQNGENPYRDNLFRMDANGGWIGTPSDLVRFAMHVDGFATTPNILSKPMVEIMTTPSEAYPRYAKGWFVNQQPNWWHGGTLHGSTSLLVRTASGLCWAALANTHTKGMDEALDRLMWDMGRAVPGWHA